MRAFLLVINARVKASFIMSNKRRLKYKDV